MLDLKNKILDIAMNLNRVGNWAADDYDQKRSRISTFLKNNSQYIDSLDLSSLPKNFKKTFRLFLKEYKILEKEGLQGPEDEIYWAERMMTWGNILTHRSKLITS